MTPRVLSHTLKDMASGGIQPSSVRTMQCTYAFTAIFMKLTGNRAIKSTVFQCVALWIKRGRQHHHYRKPDCFGENSRSRFNIGKAPLTGEPFLFHNILVTAGFFPLSFQCILNQICQCGLLSLHQDACPEYPCTGPDRKDGEGNDPNQTRNRLPHRNGNGRGHAHDHEHRGEGREKR